MPNSKPKATPQMSQLDRIVEELRKIDDPRVVYVGRRTDKRQLRVQLDVTVPLAKKILPVILEDAK